MRKSDLKTARWEDICFSIVFAFLGFAGGLGLVTQVFAPMQRDHAYLILAAATLLGGLIGYKVKWIRYFPFP